MFRILFKNLNDIFSSFFKFVAISIIKLYQFLISPLFPPSCRFIPSCSSYGISAIQKYGAFIGSWLTIKRILRCHPFTKGGYDPVK